ncbi:MAG: hypothetical protein GJ680_04120 [Alteromonadaceae bacterium]|nr:hypothetical protein [Alteromonadaceae bacterium]
MNTAISAPVGNTNSIDNLPKGEFVTLNGERFYAIYDADQMAPFFMSIISADDHWMFISSTGGLTAGRVSPETALFPYITVDRIHESTEHTGSKTIVRVQTENGVRNWEPFNSHHNGLFSLQRNLYRNTLGNKVCFEEVNHDLSITFRCTWKTSVEFGFVRECEIVNNASSKVSFAILDGLQNLLPAGTPRFTQTNSSNLVDAYKWSELTGDSKLGMFTLYSGITDRAEPCEALFANTVFTTGLEDYKVLLSSEQINGFRRGLEVSEEGTKRGIRAAYMVQFDNSLDAGQSQAWQQVANIEMSQTEVVALSQKIVSEADTLTTQIAESVASGDDALARIMGASDGFQATAEESVAEHHYANTLYNVLRGGIFDDQYSVVRKDLVKTFALFNKALFDKHAAFFHGLPEKLSYVDLQAKVADIGDDQLSRLVQEYLPITFGRRHGDPSRPWNQFAIELKDEDGGSLLSYQGNWRDIFQNWEALCLSFPEFLETVIAKFVNASTMDGYNPYRITKQGIDWEVEEPDDPWSYIGYWGDHQIIYLLKLLETSKDFHPDTLDSLLLKPIFCYANVPYRIRGFEDMLKNAKATVDFDEELAAAIDQRVEEIGSDGKLVFGGTGEVYQVNLLEKLLVALLTKLSNLVLEGGIWLNTQRPEWNDANNALVGQGLSMVTLYYLRRYVDFMQALLSDKQGKFKLSKEVATWLNSTAQTLSSVATGLNATQVTDQYRFEVLQALGTAATDYRTAVYGQEGFSGTVEQDYLQVRTMLDDAQKALEHSISVSRTEDGLYHAYNLISFSDSGCSVDSLYPMLEGQVAALSAGNIEPDVAADVLEKLFASDVYREDQKTFMLYPDREQTLFLNKNVIEASDIADIEFVQAMLSSGDNRIVEKDANGVVRFNSGIVNGADLQARIDTLELSDTDLVDAARLLRVYEAVFKHQEFTGRSGGMFGFEGLGCIYWHMVSKLLLAVNENFYHEVEGEANAEHVAKLGELYYRVREGIGFNKTPAEYGAIPTDPYSHTPKHAGAQQPGMTGQVKEELVTRIAELGIRVKQGTAIFNPALLRGQEFSESAHTFKYLDVLNNWQESQLAPSTLGFTWCQVPIVYQLTSEGKAQLSIRWRNGKSETRGDLKLTAYESKQVFQRTGLIEKIVLTLTPDMLLADVA